MDYPKFIVSNQKEESISIQRVNMSCFTSPHQFVVFSVAIVDKSLYKGGLPNILMSID